MLGASAGNKLDDWKPGRAVPAWKLGVCPVQD